MDLPTTTIIDGSGTGYVIDVTTDNVNITGFTIQYGEIGIRLWYTNHDTISNNIILNHTTGIDLAWSDYNLIVNCSLTNCTSAGIALWTTSAHNTYENCNASYCFRGFHVGWGHYNLVKNCKAWNCTQWGIVLDSCWYARVENCDVWFNDAGIVIYSFGTARYNTITDCNAYLNGIGINAYDPNSPGGYNKIYHNMLVNNTQYQARDGQYYPNEWDDGYPSGGNYWSDYKERYPNATEIDNSGIWDTQYEIAENNTDNYPLIHPYGSIRNLHTNLTYLTIQKAVDATETLDGHTIQVDAGTYHENVNVNKRLKILGAGASISIVNASDPSKHAFHVISTDNVSISGFTIAGALGNGNGGVFLNSGNNHNISGNVISSNYYGVYVNGYLSNNNTITHNQFIQNGYGINLHGSRHQVISDNVVA